MSMIQEAEQPAKPKRKYYKRRLPRTGRSRAESQRII
jgi:hypothetical protein